MKKSIIKKLLLAVIITIIMFTKTDVYAETYQGDFVDGEFTETYVYLNKGEPNGHTKWNRPHSIIQMSTGRVVYCLQPNCICCSFIIFSGGS